MQCHDWRRQICGTKMNFQPEIKIKRLSRNPLLCPKRRLSNEFDSRIPLSFIHFLTSANNSTRQTEKGPCLSIRLSLEGDQKQVFEAFFQHWVPFQVSSAALFWVLLSNKNFHRPLQTKGLCQSHFSCNPVAQWVRHGFLISCIAWIFPCHAS